MYSSIQSLLTANYLLSEVKPKISGNLNHYSTSDHNLERGEFGISNGKYNL